MSPDEVDALSDEMWDAMVRRMIDEAESIRAANAKLPKR
jgi:hypothetical protein